MRTQRRRNVLITSIVAALALTALVAGSASASIVPAKFSSEFGKISTTGLTLKKNGLEPKTCTFSAWSEGWFSGSQFWFLSEGEQIRLSCGIGLNMKMYGEATYDTVTGQYNLHFNDYSEMQLPSPYGYYTQVSKLNGFNASWVNGSGTTASTFKLANQTFGYAGEQKLTLDGTTKVTTSTGGLLTLSH